MIEGCVVKGGVVEGGVVEGGAQVNEFLQIIPWFMIDHLNTTPLLLSLRTYRQAHRCSRFVQSPDVLERSEEPHLSVYSTICLHTFNALYITEKRDTMLLRANMQHTCMSALPQR